MVLRNVIKSPIIKKVRPDFGTGFFKLKINEGTVYWLCALLRAGQIYFKFGV